MIREEAEDDGEQWGSFGGFLKGGRWLDHMSFGLETPLSALLEGRVWPHLGNVTQIKTD